MNTHKKQITAVVIISVIFILLFAGYAVLYFVLEDIPLVFRMIAGGLMTALAIGMIYVMKERIREIRKGENDDLSNY